MSDDLFTTDGELQSRGAWTLLAGVVVACFLMMLALLALTRTGVPGTASDEPALTAASTAAARAPVKSPEFILDALLVPALEPGDLPLRWRDPRAAMGCGPGSELSVDREPLRPGTAVPVVPFVLDWQAHGCHPFGPNGPRFDGRARLTIYREDWGFSAMVEPAGMRVTMGDGRIMHVWRGGAATRAIGLVGTRAPARAIALE